MIRRTAARWLTIAAVAAAPLGLIGTHIPAQATSGGGCSPFTNVANDLDIKACIQKVPPLSTNPSALRFKKPLQLNVTCQSVIRIREIGTDNVKAHIQDCTLQMIFGTTLVLKPVLLGCTPHHKYVTNLSVRWHTLNGSLTSTKVVSSPTITC
jgi:hypothetical protein